MRDWIYVDDNAAAYIHLLENGYIRDVFNVGCGHPVTNIEIAYALCDSFGVSREKGIEHVTDRLGHDRRYALDASKLMATGWSPKVKLGVGIGRTLAYYKL